jgi:type II restriction enzyme
MSNKILAKRTIERRRHWIEELAQISGQFGEDTARVERELTAEIEREGSVALFDHLLLCGAIPEEYRHDTSEEKLYSKYTDTLLAAAFRHIGLTSLVLTERADAADVEVVGADFSLVADAKAFRLSRTAKNQKDFKIEALNGWKRGKPYAMVVCPIYHLNNAQSHLETPENPVLKQ